MLTSLFGDLGRSKDRRRSPRGPEDEPDTGFAATSIMQTTATAVNESGQMVDRHQHDLVVTGSAAQAIREHFAATRADLETASRQITLLDPVGVWASAVIKALSDAGGQPIERLHLRETSTLRTLAMIERTAVLRRDEETLKIYHADVRAPGRDSAEVPVALMERSHMTAVIIGPMQPHEIDALLVSLREATALPTWRCPNLLFMLPPNAVWLANKIGAVPWPARVHVHVLNESLTSASTVWNAMLGTWNQVKSQPAWEPPNAPSLPGLGDFPDFPIRVADLGLPSAPTQPLLSASRLALNATRAKPALHDMLMLDGVLGCAVVDAATGLVLARESRDEPLVDIELSAAASAQVLRTHRQVVRSMGLSEQIDEIVTSAASRQHVIRTLQRHADLFLLALLDRHRSNLALVRFKLLEVEKKLL